MNLSTLISTLDSTNLTREVVDLKGKGETVSYGNYTGQELTLTVNETDYPSMIRICFVSGNTDVKMYITNYKPNNRTSISLSEIEEISVGE